MVVVVVEVVVVEHKDHNKDAGNDEEDNKDADNDEEETIKALVDRKGIKESKGGWLMRKWEEQSWQ